MKSFLKRFFTQDQLDAYGRFKYAILMYFAGLRFDLFERKYKTDDLEFEIPYHLTRRSFRGRFPLNLYETEERIYLKDYLNPKATVLELGGCLGVVSCLTNRLLENPAQHVVVEANPELVQYIARNKATNHCQFQIENCAVSIEPAMEFYVNDEITASSLTRKKGKKITVQGKTIDDLEAAHSLHFDTLIMDIEGGELNFFRTFRSKLPQFQKIFMEIHPSVNILSDAEVAECGQILTEAGFHKILSDNNFEIWKQK